MARDGEWAIRPDIHLPLCHQRTSPFLAESKSLQKVRARPSQRRGLLCAVLWKAPDNSSICLSTSNKQTKRLQSFIVFVLASISHYNFMLTGAGPLSVCSARKQTDERRLRDNLGRPFKRPAHCVCLFPRPPLCLFVPKLRKEKSSTFPAGGSLPRGGRCRSAQRCSCPALGRRATCDHDHHDGKDKESYSI